MGHKTSKEKYIELINEDIEALKKSNISKLEYMHIKSVPEDSIDVYYPEPENDTGVHTQLKRMEEVLTEQKKCLEEQIKKTESISKV